MVYPGSEMNPLERFEAKYIPEPMSGCFLWMAGTHKQGYGFFFRGGKYSELAHRVSWEFYRGKIPEAVHVLHRCDNPSCVNPDHLFLGTHSDNMRDCVAKGRKNMPRGAANSATKLTENQAREIKYSPEQNVDLAKRFGVTAVNIGHIKSGRAWKYL
jgi:hypothetical protein